MSEEVLQIARQRREVKGKEERERYTLLNAVFHRIARRDKVFLNEQCKEIEENNRMGKTRKLYISRDISRKYGHDKEWKW